ncbi:GIY-YIG nuclease family protein [Oceanisphaera ostreae]|uniref:GIY-YIG nuclease family protein n=1 Tax=Oceanisphaera ostreae TaxID=914151 RepID=A0ABW3KG71_9GAMM
MSKSPAVYILTNKPNGTLYVGVTGNLVQRIWQHKNHEVPGFTTRYRLNKLVYFEMLDDMYAAISREKQLKNWKREWKVELVEQKNEQWRDLWDEIVG